LRNSERNRQNEFYTDFGGLFAAGLRIKRQPAGVGNGLPSIVGAYLARDEARFVELIQLFAVSAAAHDQRPQVQILSPQPIYLIVYSALLKPPFRGFRRLQAISRN
jgi:hypothetical protein